MQHTINAGRALLIGCALLMCFTRIFGIGTVALPA